MRKMMGSALLLALAGCAANGMSSGASRQWLRPDGTYRVEVRNESDCVMTVAFGDWIGFDIPAGGMLGSVPPHGTETFTIAPTRRGEVGVVPQRAPGQRCAETSYLPVRVYVTRAPQRP
jgi:hypothetical protein